MSTLIETFTEVFAAAPDGVWSAPGRVNLIGEHTDYNGGLALPIAIPARTTVAARVRDDDRLRMHSRQQRCAVDISLADVQPGTPAGWAAYVAGVVWALKEAGYAVRGLDLVVDSEVPLGAGLSSSAALECAVGAAVSDLSDLGLLASDTTRAELARACQRAENDIAGAPTGGMDQMASLLCRSDQALRLDCRDGATEHVPFTIADHDVVVLVTDTRASHELTDSQYSSRREDCERAAEHLGVGLLRECVGEPVEEVVARLPDETLRRRTRHVLTEIERVDAVVAALRHDDLDEVGRVSVASHESLRDDYEVSSTELDLVVDTALQGGALGARMTGGGFGGSAISLVRVADADQVAAAFTRAFADAHLGAPASFTVTAAHGARRDDL